MKAMKMYKINGKGNNTRHFLYAFLFHLILRLNMSFDEVNPGTFDCLCLAEVLSLFSGLALSFPLC